MIKKDYSKYFYIETYGCQMNVSDSEIIVSLLSEEGFHYTKDLKNAGVILVNTCAVREHAEEKVLKRLRELSSLKKKNKNLVLCLVGCLAERLKESAFERNVLIDIVAGPDSYRKLPSLIEEVKLGKKFSCVELSDVETYEDILPERLDKSQVTAFVSIMRGCNNFCSYCVVPYTRGKERSRNPESICREIEKYILEGVKEITLLGQNVNSYLFDQINFPHLLNMLAKRYREIRFRFATSHPKDFSEELINVIASNDNVCKSVHLPVQSGSNRILALMNRNYTREEYLEKIKLLRKIVTDVAISTDIIAGFCSETDEDHQLTLALMNEAKFDFAYMFKYSPRSGTAAFENYPDDVDEKEKISRLQQIIALQQKLSYESNKKDIGKTFEILVEGKSKRSENSYFGRNSQNKVIVFPSDKELTGCFVKVKVFDCTPATLKGKIE